MSNCVGHNLPRKPVGSRPGRPWRQWLSSGSVVAWLLRLQLSCFILLLACAINSEILGTKKYRTSLHHTNENLNFSIQTANEFFVKRFVERSKKIMTFVISNHTQSISKSQLISKSTTKHVDQSLEKTYSNELNKKKNHMNVDEKLTYDDFDSKNFNYIFD